MKNNEQQEQNKHEIPISVNKEATKTSSPSSSVASPVIDLTSRSENDYSINAGGLCYTQTSANEFGP